MSTLVLNAGSSSLRFSLFDSKLKEIHSGHIDRIGQAKAKNHAQAVAQVLQQIDFPAIQKVAHRVVHGGEKYHKPSLLTKAVFKDLKKLSPLAPLHNPANLLCIKAAQKALPKAKHYAVFDTTFHSTLPQKAYLYGLPYSYYEKQKIRRFGFHGSSHKYVSKEAARFLGPQKTPLTLITCHMGNGISLAAIKNGVCLDTSMGFTPLEGPLMGTRSGTLDPGLILHLLKTHSVKKLTHVLEHESGFKGMSQIGSDIRDLWANPSSPGTRRTFELLSYQMAKLILSLVAPLEGLPTAIVFTGGIGENAYYLREEILSYLKPFKVNLNAAANRKNAMCISTPKSSIKILVIPTQEAVQMARDIKNY